MHNAGDSTHYQKAVFFCSLYKQKMIRISAVTLLHQTKTRPLEHIGTPMLVLPFFGSGRDGDRGAGRGGAGLVQQF